MTLTTIKERWVKKFQIQGSSRAYIVQSNGPCSMPVRSMPVLCIGSDLEGAMASVLLECLGGTKYLHPLKRTTVQSTLRFVPRTSYLVSRTCPNVTSWIFFWSSSTSSPITMTATVWWRVCLLFSDVLSYQLAGRLK